MNKTISILMLTLMSIMISACSASNQSAIETGIAQTLQISQLQTQAAGGENSAADIPQEPADGGDASVPEEATPVPSDTPENTSTPTQDIPMVSVSQNTNCRTGPAVYYGFVTTLNTGINVEVVGVPSDPSETEYVIVKNPSGSGTCWLWTRYADKTDFAAYNLQQFNTPATPTPTFTPTPSFDWSGTWTMWIVGFGPYNANFNVSGNNMNSVFTTSADVTLSGTISGNQQGLSGTWSTAAPDDGTFQFQIKSGNLNQFVGSYVDSGITYEWCGAKNGASAPSPCQWP